MSAEFVPQGSVPPPGDGGVLGEVGLPEDGGGSSRICESQACPSGQEEANPHGRSSLPSATVRVFVAVAVDRAIEGGTADPAVRVARVR